MLLQFNFKNFKSFRDETTLDMTATKITEFSDHVVMIGKEKILPVAAVFGANASGKSNVQDAFRYMTDYVIQSFAYGGDSTEDKANISFSKPTPFLFDEMSKHAETLFEVYFITSEQKGARTYNYGFTVNKDGVCEEWLNYKAKTSKDFKQIFYRNEDELELTGIPKRSQENLKIALEKETLVVSLGAKLKIEKLKLIRDWFIDNEFPDYGQPIENLILSSWLPENFVESEDVRNKVVEYFSSFDPSIIGFEVEVIEKEDEEPITIKIDAKHKMIGSNEVATIPLKLESAGTLKMFSLYPFLRTVLDAGGVLFVDELNSRLHPLLVRTIILTFTNPKTNPNNAQLIFTTHDTWQLSSNVLRRDEVWFTEKEETGISRLYSLADFLDEDGTKIRKDESFEKNYLLGKYGAIPSMKYFDWFKGV